MPVHQYTVRSHDPRPVSKFNANLAQIPTGSLFIFVFDVELGRLILSILWKKKRLRAARALLHKQEEMVLGI